MRDLEPSGEVAWPDHADGGPEASELFGRMLFSALVDADGLDTEAHFRADQAAIRGSALTLAELWDRFERNQARIVGQGSARIASARQAVYEACLRAAERPPGLFRLTVPTGGGKTRSGMAFALRHAIRHGLRRVVVAVPFISITEQTSDVYRGIFDIGDSSPIVLEHHSAAGAADPDDFSPRAIWARLAAENWDALIAVTTTVQLFESLFTNATGRARKLHRLSRSVIILDEAQSLPSHVLQPILSGLRDLCTAYGSTVVLSTATQPAFESIPAFASLEAREIVPDPAPLFRNLQRVTYDWRTRPAAWSEVGEWMRAEDQVLTIVNTKRDALTLLDALGDPEALHLSTLLCGAHRRDVIAEIRRRLPAGEPCRVVSTQVVEAGVDLDFPVVLRAIGPLDGIIQAAGRCNREGMLKSGQVIVFRPAEGTAPMGAYRVGMNLTETLAAGGGPDPDDPAVSGLYFERLFQRVDLDARQVQRLRWQLDYPGTAAAFQMIDDDTVSVAVSYGTAEQQRHQRRVLEHLRTGSPNARTLWRQIQPFVVAVRAREHQRFQNRGLIAPVTDGLGEWLGGYDAVRGLTAERLELERLVV